MSFGKAAASGAPPTSPKAGGHVGREARTILKANPKKAQVTDCRNHVLVVFDGAVMAGSLVERAGRFNAYDVNGRYLGTFTDMRAASRAVPPARAS